MAKNVRYNMSQLKELQSYCSDWFDTGDVPVHVT